jgi:hypothetical protein
MDCLVSLLIILVATLLQNEIFCVLIEENTDKEDDTALWLVLN